MNILHSLGAGIAALGLFIGGLFGYTPVTEDVSLGASLPSGTAVFETSLATGITDLSTSMVLTSTSIRGGATLSGYQCFTIDEGSAQAEYVCGTVATNTVSSLERGISPADGVTSVTALTFSHRRGANVKITDFPLIQRIQAQNSGSGTFDSVIKYGASIGTSTVGVDGQNIASVAYANSLAFGAVPAANETTAGFTELATAQEAASSTQTGGTGARLSLSTALSTSTAPASGHVVVMTGIDGNIDSGFLPDTVGSTTLRVYTTTGSSTYTKPTGLKQLLVEIVGGGGSGGAACDSDSNDESAGSGGGAGAYARSVLSASVISATTSIFVGKGGNAAITSCSGSTNGNVGSSTTAFGLVANGGSGGSGSNDSAGGSGGTASGGQLNITGGTGGHSMTDANQASSRSAIPGIGGASFFGGSNGAYGSGTKGGLEGNSATGTQGVILITEYF